MMVLGQSELTIHLVLLALLMNSELTKAAYAKESTIK